MESKATLWTGRVFTAIVGIFMLMDGIGKLIKPEQVVKATLELGFPESTVLPLGIVLIVSTVLYLIPRTAVLGAILLTGYLGGAVAAHVRMNESAFSMSFALAFGVLTWGGLYLRDAKLRALIPLKKN